MQFSVWLVYFWFDKLVLVVRELAGARSMVCTKLH